MWMEMEYGGASVNLRLKPKAFGSPKPHCLPHLLCPCTRRKLAEVRRSERSLPRIEAALEQYMSGAELMGGWTGSTARSRA